MPDKPAAKAPEPAKEMDLPEQAEQPEQSDKPFEAKSKADDPKAPTTFDLQFPLADK